VNSEDLKNCPILVLANKIDISNMSSVKIVEKLGLHQTRKVWHVQPTCALTGDGIVEGFEWLRKTLKGKK
jgi:ADP-ribosylation factor protein 1